jgi:hypothetical protein
MLPRVALAYGQMPCAASTSSRARFAAQKCVNRISDRIFFSEDASDDENLDGRIDLKKFD